MIHRKSWAFVLATLFLVACASASTTTRNAFDEGWKFARFGEMENGSYLSEPVSGVRPGHPRFDDRQWEKLKITDDQLLSSLRRQIETQGLDQSDHEGYVQGVGWYRKTFDVPMAAASRRTYIDFDGGMQQAKVYINGQMAGEWAYGCNSFRVDVTPHLKFGVKNTISVRYQGLPASLDWSPVSEISGHVWLIDAPQVHIAHWGTYINTPEVSRERAVVEVETTVDNTSGESAQLIVRSEILDDGHVVATQDTALETSGFAVARCQLEVMEPKRWRDSHPVLYVLRTTLLRRGVVVDLKETPFGVRENEWDEHVGGS